MARGRARNVASIAGGPKRSRFPTTSMTPGVGGVAGVGEPRSANGAHVSHTMTQANHAPAAIASPRPGAQPC